MAGEENIMNKTQKSAWCGLVVTLTFLLLCLFMFIELTILKKMFFFMNLLGATLLFGLVVAWVIFIRKKQSPTEVETDERDKLIQTRAIVASFISVGILIALTCLILRFIVGISGTIAVWELTLVNFLIFEVALLVYSVAILVQYGLGGKDGEK
jgi:hypothetical protein